MREISREELEKILVNHLHWIKEDCEGWEDMRADLSCANLSHANLSYADLSQANLSQADLSYANLSQANLSQADLSCANLSHTNLFYADLSHANLFYANLSQADLSYANLSHADLSCANLFNAKNIPYIPMACPDSGAFIAWKRASGYIVKLFIPSDAKRMSATGRKCRCDKATVIGIENLDGTTADITEVASDYDSSFKYAVHGHVSVDNFCEDRWRECSQGIHFFINRQEAVNY